jgi:hypothetical protein
MSKFTCVCGYQIKISGEIPNPLEWRLLSSVEFERFEGEVDAEDVYLSTTAAYLCPQSGHFWVFWHGYESEPALYSPTQLPFTREVPPD